MQTEVTSKHQCCEDVFKLRKVLQQVLNTKSVSMPGDVHQVA